MHARGSWSDSNPIHHLHEVRKRKMNELFRLKEDLPLDEDWFGVRKPAGVAKAGTLFELVREPTPQKKKYKLKICGVKFPYDLYLRKNDFQRLFEKVE